MSLVRRLLARRAKDAEERRRNDAIEIEEMEEEEEIELVAAISAMEQEGQSSGGSRIGRAPNLDRRRHSRGANLQEDYFIPTPLYPYDVFRMRYRMHRPLFFRIMTNLCNHNSYFIQKPDALGVMGLLPEQKLTAALQMLAYGAAADQVDDITRLGNSTALDALRQFCDGIYKVYSSQYLRRPTRADLHKLLKRGEQRRFPAMIGSIDYMHWEWKNCPTGRAGTYQNRKGRKTIILEAVACFDTWIWNAFFGCPGAQNDINVLHQSDVFDPVVSGIAPQVKYNVNERTFSGAYYLVDQFGQGN